MVIMEFSHSLKNNRDFKRLYHRGKSCADKFLVLYCLKSRDKDAVRLGITVSGKLGNAVKRNRIRRRIKEAFRINEPFFLPGFDIVVVARSRAADAKFNELCSSLLSLASRQGIIRVSSDKSSPVRDA